MRTPGFLFFLFLFFCLSAEITATPVPVVNRPEHSKRLYFIENKGQLNSPERKPGQEILYMLRSPGLTIYVHRGGLIYQFLKTEITEKEKTDPINAQLNGPQASLPLSKGMATEESFNTLYQLAMDLPNANNKSLPIAENQTPYFENHFGLPQAPEGIDQVRSFEKVTLKEVYPNIDWVLYIKDGGLKYDFIVKPGGNISDIKMKYSGAAFISSAPDGSLSVKTPLGHIKEEKPYAYQQDGGSETERETHFTLLNQETVGFKTGSYDSGKPLIIDPAISWATYFGARGEDFGNTMAVDADGNIYYSGSSIGTRDVGSENGNQRGAEINYDAFLVKYNAQGEKLWTTWFGGNKDDEGYELTLDKRGNIFLVGYTVSSEGIASNGFQNTHGGSEDAFLAKFNPEGSLLWATYYGGEGNERSSDIMLDNNNQIYIAGFTGSRENFTSAGFQNSFGGFTDAFLVKFNAEGDRLWATYYGGSGEDVAAALALDPAGAVYLSGTTKSPQNIASNGFRNSHGGNYDGFIAKFSPDGNRIWGTYYGGSGIEYDNHIATDKQGNIYLNGITGSGSGIATADGFQPEAAGNNDAFLVKFNSDGQRLWATYYGGSGTEGHASLFTDATDHIYLAGSTGSRENIAACGFQNAHGGGIYDVFLVKFNTEGERQWGTYYGGEGEDIPYDPKADTGGSVYLTGSTSSTQNIAVNGSQGLYGGGISDAFLAKIDPASSIIPEPEILAEGPNPLCGENSLQLSVPHMDGVQYEWKRNNQLLPFTENAVTVTESGSYTVKLLSDCNQPESKAVEVFSFENDAPKITYNGSLHLCGEESLTLELPDLPDLSYQWKKDGVITGDQGLSLQVTQAGTYSAEISGECGITESSNTITVTSGEALSPPLVQDITQCGPGSFTLTAEGSSSGRYRWYTEATAVNPVPEVNGPEYVTPDLETTTTFYVSAAEGECESERVAIKAIVMEAAEAYAGEDVTVHYPQKSQLQASGGNTYQWSPAEGLDNPYASNPVAGPEKTTTYTVTATNSNGCESTDEVTVHVLNEVILPNAFSPNMDGTNDVWDIILIEAYPDCRVSIFNKWGNLVFESTGYQNPWDGTWNGRELPSGSYKYVIRLDSKKKPIFGMVTLIR